MANESKLMSLDDYFQNTHIGSIDRAIGNNLYGINHTQIQSAVPSNKEQYGLTFFTRPQLNMQKDNIRNMRIFSPLLTDNVLSVQMYIKCILDPRLMYGYNFNPSSKSNAHIVQPINTPLVDNKMAFIPILTNNLNSISGWPDITSPTFTSSSGLEGEEFSIVDGLNSNKQSFDIDASFRNTKGDVILYMFYIWEKYMSHVFEGKLVPYIDYIVENMIDYNTRIYRLVLDKNRNIVTKIGATGAAFPISVPTGSFFDFNKDKPYNDQNNDITIRFKCMGAEYLDDILLMEFNKTVEIFNPSMKDKFRERDLILIPNDSLSLYNHRAYPRINPKTNALEWWMFKDVYESRSRAFLQQNVGNPDDKTFEKG